MSRYSRHLNEAVEKIDVGALDAIGRATFHAHTLAATKALTLFRCSLGRRGDLHGWEVFVFTHCGETYLMLRDPGLFHPPAARRLSEFDDHFSETTQELLDWAEESLGKVWGCKLNGYYLVSPVKADLGHMPSLY